MALCRKTNFRLLCKPVRLFQPKRIIFENTKAPVHNGTRADSRGTTQIGAQHMYARFSGSNKPYAVNGANRSGLICLSAAPLKRDQTLPPRLPYTNRQLSGTRKVKLLSFSQRFKLNTILAQFTQAVKLKKRGFISRPREGCRWWRKKREIHHRPARATSV